MKLLLDESLPRRLKREFAGHDLVTVAEAGWSGCSNGELPALAASRFDALITVDLNLRYQQNLQRSELAVVVLRARSDRLADLPPLVPKAIKTLEWLKAGQVTEVSQSRGYDDGVTGMDASPWPRTLQA